MTWDAKCTTLTLTGTDADNETGKDKVELMTGMCPGGAVIAKGFCWA